MEQEELGQEHPYNGEHVEEAAGTEEAEEPVFP
jgi:hypothetical protein